MKCKEPDSIGANRIAFKAIFPSYLASIDSKRRVVAKLLFVVIIGHPLRLTTSDFLRLMTKNIQVSVQLQWVRVLCTTVSENEGRFDEFRNEIAAVGGDMLKFARGRLVLRSYVIRVWYPSNRTLSVSWFEIPQESGIVGKQIPYP